MSFLNEKRLMSKIKNIAIIFFSSFILLSCDEKENKNNALKSIDGTPQGSDFSDNKESDFITEYIRLWGKGEYDDMYACLSDDAKKEMTLQKFVGILSKEKESNGGVKNVSSLKKASSDNVDSIWSMTLNFKRSTARSVNIKVTLTRNNNRIEIKEGGLIPLNNDEYNR